MNPRNAYFNALRTLVLSSLAASSALAVDLNVVSLSPARHSLSVPIASPISITFDRAVLASTVNSNTFMVFGRNTGPVAGTYALSNGNLTVTFTPDSPLISGETVIVGLARPLQAVDLSLMRSSGYYYMFTTRTRPAPNTYTEIAQLTNRTAFEIANGIPTRIYGAMSADLNHDGNPDLTTVNEDSNDLRVLLHTGNPVAPYNTFLTPFPISHEASPNEPADFNRDGHADIAVAASSASSGWVVLGNGVGNYGSGQEIPVPTSPHGVAVLDVDGDGDTDFVTTNTSSNHLSLMLNNGSGMFGAPSAIEGGCNGEYGVTAADMNNDGIMDLVVGCIFSEEISILRGNGNGTFTHMITQDSGGSAWMVVCGDVNGDGNMDVTVANSQSNNGGILLGNGAFGLGLPAVTGMPGAVVATDLGDLDGDGDLDWVMSSFSGQVWRLHTNNGAGVFTFNQSFPAVNNPSCAIIFDFDDDRDLDLVLTDEIADVIKLKRNGGIRPLGDHDNDLDVDDTDLAAFESCFSGPGGSIDQACTHGDMDGDGDVDCHDYTLFADAWTAAGEAPEIDACPSSDVPAMNIWGFMGATFVIVLAGVALIRRQTAQG